MRKVRCLLCAALLTFVFTASALAGDTQTPGHSDPPPPPDEQHSVTIPGGTEKPGRTDESMFEGEAFSDLLIEVLLSVF
jgi:hypothetical protein